MNGDGSVSFAWAGDMHTFNVGKIKSLRELQEKCNAGPMEVLMRLQMGTWRVEDYREVIRLGLLGAGVAQNEVARLVKFNVDEAPPIPNVVAAKAILSCGLSWPKDDVVGEPVAEESKEAAASSSPQSMDAGQPWDFLQEWSMNSHSGSYQPVSMDTTGPMEETTNRPLI